MHETGQWPSVKMSFCKKKPKAAKFSDHRTFSFFANTANFAARISKRRIGRKLRTHV
jgi:hypothetical protein